MTNLQQENHSPGQDQTREHPKYKSGMSLLQQNDFNQPEFTQQTFKQSSNIINHENSSSGSRWDR